MKQLTQLRMQAAIELLEFKAMAQMCKGKTTCALNEADVNEILVVAGAGVITPQSFEAKELEAII